MKRSAPIVTVSFILLAGAAVVLLTSTLPCPDCRPTGREQPSPNQRISPDCPRCGDAGRVSRFNRWFRRDLDPDVALLFDEPYFGLADNPSRYVDALQRLLRRSGTSVAVGLDTVGSAVFLDDGHERLPAAFVCSLAGLSALGGSRCLVLLFDPSGTLLDRMEISLLSGPLQAEWMPASPSGRELHVDRPPGGLPALIDVAQGTRRRTYQASAVAVRAERGKLVVVARGERP